MIAAIALLLVLLVLLVMVIVVMIAGTIHEARPSSQSLETGGADFGELKDGLGDEVFHFSTGLTGLNGLKPVAQSCALTDQPRDLGRIDGRAPHLPGWITFEDGLGDEGVGGHAGDRDAARELFPHRLWRAV
jgi:hypothetical protein